MLEFKKMLLDKVSFDLKLFEKELKKAINWLLPEEVEQLKSWCYNHFMGEHKLVLDKHFAKA